GSGTDTLTFTYVVAAGHSSPDLDYTATTALTGSLQDGAANGADLTLASPGAAGSLGANKDIVIDSSIPTVIDVSSSTADGTYNVGASIVVTVTFSETVNVTGTPQLTLATAIVDYTAGSGTDTLTFTYVVAVGHNSADLDYAAVNALTGTIQDVDSNNAILMLFAPGAAGSLGANKNIVVDTTPPTVTGVSSTTADGTYGAGASVDVTVTFSEPVTGAPQLTLATGGPGTVVDYVSGSGTNTLTFTYTVAAGHNSLDLDYTATTALAGAVQDAAGNDADLALAAPGAAGSLAASKAIVIDTTTPSVTSVSSSTADGTYGIGAVIAVTVTFSEPVTISGTPQITLATGGLGTAVNCAGGSGTDTLTFTYTVAAGHNSVDLDYVAADALTGTIQDAAGNAADLALPTPSAAGSLAANKAIVLQTTPPAVVNVSSSAADGAYNAGNLLPITVAFSEPVFVTGVPLLTLETGVSDAVLSYSGGSGTATLLFDYTVGAGHVSADLDCVSSVSLNLNGGTIRDALSNDALIGLPAPGAANSLGANKNIVIDTTAPTVTSVTSTAADGTYAAGALIDVTVTFTELVIGTPQLTLATGGPGTAVNYSTGSGTDTLTFTYTVAAGHNSSDLDYVSINALNGAVQDVAGNGAVLTLPAPSAAGSLGANKAIVVDTAPPTVANVTSIAADGTYGVGGSIDITIIFSEAVTGTPQLTLATGGPGTTVNYTSGSGTSTLTFTYTVGAGQNSSDLDYISTNALSGAVQDAAGNSATPTLAAPGAAGSLGANKAIVIDTTAPTVTNVTSTTADGTYGVGATIVVTVTFSETVTVTGTPQLTLVTSTVDYMGGSGTDTLTFTYAVAAGHASFDLDYVSTNALSGAIQDAAGNSAALTLAAPGAAGSLGANKAIVIDTTAPAQPGPPDLDAASDTGSSSTDDLTSDTTPTLTGTAEANAVIDLYADASWVGTATANGAGSYTVTSAALADGSYDFTVTATDAAGNVSLASPALVVAIDATVPADITDLAVTGTGGTSITVSWTSPGSAAVYDVRYATSPITTEAQFAAATAATGEPAPAGAGTPQSTNVTGLSESTTYYFAIKSADNVPNWSALSNSPAGTTSDATAPAAIADLSVTGTTATTATLSWTAPGDDGGAGTASSYDLRMSAAPIVTDADFVAAAVVTGEPAPAVAGTGQSMNVTGLSETTTYYFAIKTADEVPNWSPLSNSASGTTLGGAPPPPVLEGQFLSDGVTAIAVGGPTTESLVVLKGTVTDPNGDPVELQVEVKPLGTPFGDTPTITSGLLASGSTASVSPAILSDGGYHWQARAVDGLGNDSGWVSFAGNLETEADFVRDTIAPDSNITTNGFFGAATYAGMVQGTASDGGSGVALVQVTIQRTSDGFYWTGSTWGAPMWLDATGTTTWAYTFTPSDGEVYSVESLAVDGAGQTETVPASTTWTYDATEPDSAAVTSGAQTSATYSGAISGSASDATSGVTSVSLTIQRASDGWYWTGAGWGGSTWLLAGGTVAWSYSFAPANLETYTVQTRATDGAGNPEAALGFVSFSYNLSGPDSTVSTSGASTSWSGSVAGTAATTGGASVTLVEITLDRASDGLYWTGAGWGAATWLPAAGTDSWTYPFAALEGVGYTVQSRATDSYGNVEASPGTASFVYDATPPTSVITTAGSFGRDVWSATIQGTASDGASGVLQVEVRVQRLSDGLYWSGSAWQLSEAWLVAAGTTNWALPFAGELNESYAVAAQATDAATNVQSAASSSSFMLVQGSKNGRECSMSLRERTGHGLAWVVVWIVVLIAVRVTSATTASRPRALP
ncbi:MAG: fibronectin type III domain-containing protein, partial [Planctomycetes bacterium]|nr:fibronectin type III domain-containing protein [Planctomycetota bacterium]